MTEIWKDIKGFEGLYQVSNLGRVKSLKRRTTPGKILKPHKTKKYLQACLCKKGKQELKSIHRLVAEAFIENVYNLPEVNHKDENKENNCAENLEWCTTQYNANYGTRNERIVRLRKKAVMAFDIAGKLIERYESIKEAAKKTGTAPINICRCCKGVYKSSGGFIWKYAESGDIYGG